MMMTFTMIINPGNTDGITFIKIKKYNFCCMQENNTYYNLLHFIRTKKPTSTSIK